MKVTVELIYADTKRNHKIDVEVKAAKVTPTFLDKVDRAVEKAASDDSDWTRWNLVEIQDEVM